jgi:uncharacterized protein YsxB (DUF464 family)
MISVTLRRDSTGFVREFKVDGHAGYAKKGNDDIVCSAISVLAYTAVGALSDLAGANPDWTERDGHMECLVPDPEKLPTVASGMARTILDTFALGCRQVEGSYGRKHVRVTDASLD